MAQDHLAGLKPPEVAGWYRRLADRIGSERIGGKEPLASQLLRHYLENRDPKSTYTIDPPAYLATCSQVFDTLRFQRRVFLTEEKGHLPGKQNAWVGIVPRIQGRPGFTRWDLARPLDMHYESLVEIGSGPLDIARIQKLGSSEERDLFAALRGFQLLSTVVVNGTQLPSRRELRITFASWMCHITDRYDFDPKEHLTLPNPDYQSKAKDAVRPQDRDLVVYHTNAQRLEQAGLAAPYDLKSRDWRVNDARIIAPADINPAKSL